LVDIQQVAISQNAAMPSNEEKSDFSKRLQLALRRSQEPIHGATELALRFNLRHHGDSVSPQTTHKWLNGKSIPAGEKLTTLAEWLDVDEHWLHYGPPPARKLLSNPKKTMSNGMVEPTPEAIALATKIQCLPPHQRYLVEELVEQLHQDVG
jgi:transcriptional regulator with XRE-family HTH domain